jgi:hypothetical protein
MSTSVPLGMQIPIYNVFREEKEQDFKIIDIIGNDKTKPSLILYLC